MMFSFRPLLLAVSMTLVPYAHASAAATDLNSHEITPAAGSFSIDEKIPDWVVPTAVPATEANIAALSIALMDTQVEVGPKTVTYVQRLLRVNDATMLTRAGQIAIPFFPQYQHLRLHAIHIKRGSSTIDCTRNSFVHFVQRETGLEQGELNGAVTASILVNDLRAGDLLEVAYSTEGENPVFGEHYVSRFSWDREVPVERRHVSILYPATQPLYWTFLNDSGLPTPVAETSHSANWNRLDFTGNALPPISTPTATPTDFSPAAWLQVSGYADWNAVTHWALPLFQQAEPGPDMVALAAKLRREHPQSAEQVVAALSFVQSEIRYFSLALGESSFRPAAPTTVLQRRYGDCKDKTLLLKALLDQLGIESHPVLLANGVHHQLDHMQPNPLAFDHAILQVRLKGKTYYLDATMAGQISPLDQLGKPHIGEQALVIAPETRGIIAIPDTRAPDFSDDEEHDEILIPRFADDARYDKHYVFHGLEAEMLRVFLRMSSREQIRQFFETRLSGQFPEAHLRGELDIQDDVPHNAISVCGHYTVPKLVQTNSGSHYLPYLASNLAGSLRLDGDQPRLAPLGLLHYPYHGQYTLDVQLPDNVSKLMDPIDQGVESPVFRYHAQQSFRGNRATLHVDLRLLDDRVAAADYGRYLADTTAVRRIMPGYLTIDGNELKPEVTTGAESSLAQQLHSKVEKNLAALNRLIESGKLGGDDLALSYCHRAEVYTDMNQGALALHDIDEANRLAPESVDVKICRGDIFFELGQFPRSVAEYTSAIALGVPDAVSVYQRRAISRYFNGQTAATVQDLRKARQSALEQKVQAPYLDLWLALLLPRLGEAIPDDVMARAQAPTGNWPQPLLATLAGKLPEADLLQALQQSRRGDELIMDQTEAYFYLGEYWLGKGEPARARDRFDRVRGLGVIVYSEYISAGLELARLAQARSDVAAMP